MTMGDRAGCLSDEEIALAAEGSASPAERALFEAHVGDCAACRARWAEAHEPAPSPAGHPLDAAALARAAAGAWRVSAPVPAFRRSRFPRVAIRVGVAAAAAILAAWGLGLFAPGTGTGRARALPEGRAIAGRGERIGTAAEVVQLPDGSRFRVAAGSAVVFDLPGPGERITARLARGTLEADVVKGTGSVRIVSEAGEIRVVGTVFTAKAFDIHPSPLAADPSPFPVLSVEVTGGAVEIAGAAGTVRVAAGRRGIVRAGKSPVLQEAAPLGWREAARRWGGSREDLSFAGSWGAVTLLAGRWDGIAGWEEALDAAGEPADLRRVAAALVGIAAGPDEAARLKGRFERETDEGTRLALLPHAARTQGEAAADWLARVAGADASMQVRREASGLLEAIRKPR